MILAAVAASTLFAPAAMAQDPMNAGASAGAVTGGVTGAVIGGVVGGPVGAVVGGGIGATTGATTGAAVGVGAAEQNYARDYVVKRQVPDERIDGDVVVGEPLPSTVRVYRIEGNPKLANYHYAYVNDRYVLVDDRLRVVKVIN
jgi:hypothetical protein